MEEMMGEAAQAGDMAAFYELLKNEPELLNTIDLKPFYDTPSHVAVSAGHTLFLLETFLLKPSFGKKLNHSGLSPLHLALQSRHFETAKQVVKHHPELIRVKGRGRMIPLHYVAEMGEIDLLAEFLMACPSSVEDLTALGESVVHVAVKNRCRGSFEVIFGWLIRFGRGQILLWRDGEGTTALHIAAITNQPEVVSSLVKRIPVNDRNSEGLTALDIAMKFPGEDSERIKKILKQKGALPAESVVNDVSIAEFLRYPRRVLIETMVGFDIYVNLGLSGDMRNALLVVAVLIATATYQSMLQPPGGYMQVDSTNDTTDKRDFKLVMPAGYSYPFMWLNTFAFASSVRMISFLISPSGWYNIVLHASLLCLILSYSWTLFAVSPSWISPLIYSVTFDVPYILQLWPFLFKLLRSGWLNDSKYQVFGDIGSYPHIWRSVLRTFLSKNGG